MAMKPVVKCPKCGKEFELDPATYYMYKGPIKCEFCGSSIRIEVEWGDVKSVEPA